MHTPIIKVPAQWEAASNCPPEVVPLSPAERRGIAVARLAKGGSSQSGTTPCLGINVVRSAIQVLIWIKRCFAI